jgi:fructose-1,6-bisphosphatase/inositol monophosphatase family enzyme
LLNYLFVISVTMTEECTVACNIATLGGVLLQREVVDGKAPRGSGSHADVDDEIDHLVATTLSRLYPLDGIVSEEGGSKEGSSGRIWWVDPHDGTKNFLKGHRETSVSIGLVDNGQPVVGVVYLPNNSSVSNSRMFSTHALLDRSFQRPPPSHRIAIPVSRKHPFRSAMFASDSHFVCASIATRLALVAAGDADATLCTHPLHPWDFAAGHALLHCHGCVLLDETFADVTWTNAHPSHSSQRFVAARDRPLAEALMKEVLLAFPLQS